MKNFIYMLSYKVEKIFQKFTERRENKQTQICTNCGNCDECSMTGICTIEKKYRK